MHDFLSFSSVACISDGEKTFAKIKAQEIWSCKTSQISVLWLLIITFYFQTVTGDRVESQTITLFLLGILESFINRKLLTCVNQQRPLSTVTLTITLSFTAFTLASSAFCLSSIPVTVFCMLPTSIWEASRTTGVKPEWPLTTNACFINGS